MMDQEWINKLVNEIFPNSSIKSIQRLGGLTNRSYKVKLDNGKPYVVRLPGEGTSDLEVDTKLLYFGDDGVKISDYIDNAITCDAEKLREIQSIKDVAHIFHTLHTCGKDTGVKFEVFEMAKNYEDIINKYHVDMYDDYQVIKNTIMKIKSVVDEASIIKKVPCHNDSLCENWVYGNDRLYLIDWEYAGMNDGMWDLADVSIEADYSPENDTLLLSEYFGRAPSEIERHRFIANKLYLDYLWTLWGKTRVPFDGESMEEYALQRYLRLKKNIKIFEEN